MRVDTTLDRITGGRPRAYPRPGRQENRFGRGGPRAAVTRVTVYRYCGNKKAWSAAVCLRIAAVFQRAAEWPAHRFDLRHRCASESFRRGVKRHAQGRFAGPAGRDSPALSGRVCRISRLRQAAVDAIFQQALAVATRERSLRRGANLEVLKAIFWAAVVGLIENPALVSSSISLAEIFTTVTEVFRHGHSQGCAGRRGAWSVKNDGGSPCCRAAWCCCVADAVVTRLPRRPLPYRWPP